MKRIMQKQIETGQKIIDRDRMRNQLDMNLTEMHELIQQLERNEIYGAIHNAFLFGLAVGYRAGKRAEKRKPLRGRARGRCADFGTS